MLKNGLKKSIAGGSLNGLGTLLISIILAQSSLSCGLLRRSEGIDQTQLEVLKPGDCNTTNMELWATDAHTFTAIIQEGVRNCD